MICMVNLTLGIHENIIYENNDKHIKILAKNMIHEVHEGCGSIGESERHDKKLKVTITGVLKCIFGMSHFLNLS